LPIGPGKRIDEAQGFAVGDLLRISCGAVDARVGETSDHWFAVEWPWRQIDQSSRFRWNGRLGFPRDPGSVDWRNTPWRTEPDGWDLETGDNCFVGIPETEVCIMWIEHFDPPGDLGWLPRPSWGLAVCPVEHRGDGEAGYMLYLESDEPIDIEVIGRPGPALGRAVR
jgi:hypothetical protein